MRSPQRLLLVLLSVPILFLFYLYLHSDATISDLLSTHAPKLPDEIFGLLHFVTSPDEAGRAVVAVGDPTPDGASNIPPELGVAIVPEKPVAMAWYALGSASRASTPPRRKGPATSTSAWKQRLKVLREEYPLVVFSKSYCPYSKRAKKLLEIYNISPPPKIIEVDLRADPSHIKTLLTRLTHRSTFPNVILHGRSIGGSDELVRLHEEGRLLQVLEEGGVQVKWTGTDTNDRI